MLSIVREVLHPPFLVSEKEDNVFSRKLVGAARLRLGKRPCPEPQRWNGHRKSFEYGSSSESSVSAHHDDSSTERITNDFRPCQAQRCADWTPQRGVTT